MEHLLFTLNKILPILIPIFLGYILKRIGFLKEDFLAVANRLCFRLFIPILLFAGLYNADISSFNLLFVLFCAGSILVLFGLGFIISLSVSNVKQKGVVMQSVFRSNYALIGIPLATTLAGEQAIAGASLIAGISVPMFNILGVISLTIFNKTEDGKRISVRDILKKIVTNPLIIAVVCGLVWLGMSVLINSLTDGGMTRFYTTCQFFPSSISLLADIATPFSLLVLGGRFRFTAVKRLWKIILSAVTIRLLITPVLFLSLAYVLKFNSPEQFAVLIALFGTPTAVSSAPMAGEMGQDEELAGQIVVWTSALSAFSLFFIVLACSWLGIFV